MKAWLVEPSTVFLSSASSVELVFRGAAARWGGFSLSQSYLVLKLFMVLYFANNS
jgi:hypothetical protein